MRFPPPASEPSSTAEIEAFVVWNSLVPDRTVVHRDHQRDLQDAAAFRLSRTRLVVLRSRSGKHTSSPRREKPRATAAPPRFAVEARSPRQANRTRHLRRDGESSDADCPVASRSLKRPRSSSVRAKWLSIWRPAEFGRGRRRDPRRAVRSTGRDRPARPRHERLVAVVPDRQSPGRNARAMPSWATSLPSPEMPKAPSRPGPRARELARGGCALQR